MAQIWRDIEGYNGIYEVSTTGRVRNKKRNKELRPAEHRTGYLSVALYKDGVPKRVNIHRLVADAFLPKDKGKPFVNHKDENKWNNNLNNLEWCTRNYNMNYGSINTRISKRRGHDSRKQRGVIQADVYGNIIAIWTSIAKAARSTGTARTSIYECCNGYHNTANGYVWEYIVGAK